MPLAKHKSSYWTSSNRGQAMPLNPNMGDFAKNAQTAVWRHEYTSAVLGSGTILANSYLPIPLVEFRRTFSVGGGIDDKPPIPNAGNNFPTPEVFNSSKIENFKAVVHLSTRGSAPGYITVYEAAYSFFDAYLHNAIYPSQCPVTFTSAIGTEDHRGEVNLKTPTTTLITTNLIKGLKFLQHYIRPIGKVYLPAINAQNGATDIVINDIPAKCRRANSGMFYGIFLHNDSTDNNSLSISVDASVEVKFDEIPADFRMPYLN